MRKALLACALAATVITFSGCIDFSEVIETVVEPAIEFASKATELSENALSGLGGDDFEMAKSIFSQKTTEREDFDAQLEAAMEFFEGEFVSSSSFSINSDSTPDPETGKQMSMRYDVEIGKIVTSTGKTYSLCISAYTYFPDYPELVGVYYLRITDANGDFCEIGEK